MKIIKKVDVIKENRRLLNGLTIGFVPTMGYFHDGHLSLIDRSIEENDVTVVSVFVNPAQFGPGEDLNRYPRDFRRDRSLLEDKAVDWVFFPDSREMYGPDHDTYVQFENLAAVLCGKSRPIHFKGVATVVLKLFNIIQPTRAYFGQKDAQQAIIIKRMCRDLNLEVDIRVCPIVRDGDGLAMSSRNKYLSEEERDAALTLPRALGRGRDLIAKGLTDGAQLVKEIRSELRRNPLVDTDYVEIVDLNRLQPLEKIDPRGTLVAAAVNVGSTRLIDNFVLGEI